MQNLDDKKLLEEFRLNNLKAFEEFFRTLQPPLVAYAYKILSDWEPARDIVQDLFISVWENRHHLEIHTTLKAYLFSAVKNQCSNFIKHKIVEQKYSDKTKSEFKQLEINYYQGLSEPHYELYQKELGNKINQVVDSLPEQCRITFQLSRYHGLKSNDIAQKMGISVRTVETQIYRALKTLKASLKNYLNIF